MKTCIFVVSFFLAMVMVSAFSTEEHVKRFFRPEHKAYLPETTSLTLEDESALASVPQNDDSTKCLSVCEPKCDKLDVPDYLTVNITLFHILFVGFQNKRPVFSIYFMIFPWHTLYWTVLQAHNCLATKNVQIVLFHDQCLHSSWLFLDRETQASTDLKTSPSTAF